MDLPFADRRESVRIVSDIQSKTGEVIAYRDRLRAGQAPVPVERRAVRKPLAARVWAAIKDWGRR